ncbi:SH3 domain-containing protein [Planococcus shenhongbingii]|uniref:SH3 domain-containing protein n=1 Tax=Planococcus shenhongbingii TaxID=3058398 RepID=A0ABT8N9Z3_9BACL|nr:SH3 domain-containing protein [Planococcus sp. N017]MDN7244705.1 SH3 domain-containing protein [Planococcus sp. N017]
MKKILSAIVILFILLPMFSSVTEASTFHEVKKTEITTPLRVKASPKADVITSLPKGTFVTQLNTVKGGWSHVQVKGKKGYVATSALAVSNGKIKIVNSKIGAVLRETASPKSKIVATLRDKLIVEDFGAVAGGWSFVQYGNLTGYVSTKSISVTKPVKKYTKADATLRNVTSTTGKKTGSLKKNKEIYVHSNVSGWSYVTSGSLRGYMLSSQVTATKPKAEVQTLKTFTNLRPSKINWMKYYFDGDVLNGTVEKRVYGNEYGYVVPSVYTGYSPGGFIMGAPESDFIWTDIPTPLIQNKPTRLYEFDWNLEKDVHVGNAYLRTTNATITTPAGTFKNVVHIEEKYYDLSFTIHYYFAPGYGLIKVKDSKGRLSYELRSYK